MNSDSAVNEVVGDISRIDDTWNNTTSRGGPIMPAQGDQDPEFPWNRFIPYLLPRCFGRMLKCDRIDFRADDHSLLLSRPSGER